MKEFYTITDLRAHYGNAIGRDRLSRLMNAGHIKCVIINAKRVVHRSEVERFDRLLMSDQPVLLKDRDGSVLIEKGRTT